MISNISSYIVRILIRNEAIKLNQAPLYQYGFEIFISSIITCMITIVCGILFRCLSASLIYFGLFIILRTICGGYHAKTYFKCNLIFLLVTIIVLLTYTYIQIEQFIQLHYYIIAISIFIVTKYTPIENTNKLLSKKQKKFFRILGLKMISILNIMSSIVLVKYNSSYGILIDMTALSVSVSMFIAKLLKGGKAVEKNI